MHIPGLAWLMHNVLLALQAVQMRLGEMTAPSFLVLVLLILILERLIPARPGEKIFRASLLQDSMWFFIQAVGAATIVAAYILWLKGMYEKHLDFLTIAPVAALPGWLSLLLGFVFVDFLHWLQHVLHHKVPWFWHFHAVHHSQRNINLFTDYRYHVGEYLVRQTVYFIPLMMFGVELPEMVLLSLFLVWHARFYHSNIKSNLGFLRYIIVTPQSHRVHHSIEAQHRDKNYGAFFSFWDRIFRTQSPDYLSYPETGVSEPHFPHDDPSSVLKVVLRPIAQLLYPFKAIAKSLYPGG